MPRNLQTYVIEDARGAIRCLFCSTRSSSQDDIRQRFCRNCKIWHRTIPAGLVEFALKVEELREKFPDVASAIGFMKPPAQYLNKVTAMEDPPEKGGGAAA